MEKLIKMMEEFHQAFNHPINFRALIANPSFIKLRSKLHLEEGQELSDELWDCSQTGIISPNLLKEASDLLYVLLGTLVALGIADNFEEAFTRVHVSNMSKLGEDGKPIYREDGKVLKGPNYQPPDLNDLIPYDCPHCRDTRDTKLISIHKCGCV